MTQQNCIIENWFSTPIYYSYVDTDTQKLLSEEIQKDINTLQKADLDNPWNDGVKTSFKHNSINNFLQNSKNFVNVVGHHCKKFCDYLDVDIDYIQIAESWINLSEFNDYQHFHDHVPYTNDISGVYYDKTTGDGLDGKIEFKNPNLVTRSSFLLSNYSENVSFIPESGKIILFPSFLEHCVYKNETEQTRVSVSFNIRLGS